MKVSVINTMHTDCHSSKSMVLWDYLSSVQYMMPQDIIPLTLHTMPSFHSCYVSEGDNLSFSSPLCRCCLMMLYFSLHCLCQCTVEVTTDTTMEINGYNHMLILSCRTQVLLIVVLSDLLLITREMTTHITTSLFLAKGGATPY